MLRSDVFNYWMVCVYCPTYNQSGYITDALNGFVMQHANFPFVCCIVDDASTDGEQEVIKKYLLEHFDMQESSVAYDRGTDYGHVSFARHKTNKNCYFSVIYLKENHYRKKSKITYIKKWVDNAKYIAACEGDDYWIDPLKLQKQVSYLEEHKSCCMTAHFVQWEIKGELCKMGCQHQNECDLTTEEIIRNNGLYVPSCSLVYRKELIDYKPLWRTMFSVGDFPLKIIGTLKGTFHYFPEAMGVYRFQVPGSWTSKNKVATIEYAKNKLESFEQLNKETNSMYKGVIYYNLFPSISFLFSKRQISLLRYFRAGLLSEQKYYKRAIKDYIKRDFKWMLGKHRPC